MDFRDGMLQAVDVIAALIQEMDFTDEELMDEELGYEAFFLPRNRRMERQPQPAIQKEELMRLSSLRKEQDAAYQESLRADQEKDRKKQEKQDRLKVEEAKQKAIQEERQRLKEELMKQIPPEPEASDSDSIHIAIKTPSGKRLQRRFNKKQSSKFLYYFVFCSEDCPDDFKIVTNFPRRVLKCQPTSAVPEPRTLQDLGLGKKELLFIQDNEA